MDEHGAYAYITYYERFGSWADALEEAFGAVPDREWENVSDAELLVELRQLAGDDGSPPTLSDIRERGEHAASTYRDRFGSWADALEAAGFEPPPPQDVTTEALLTDLRRLHDEFGGRPTTTIVREHGRYSVPTYYNRFDSWDNALNTAFETVPEDTVNSETGDERSRAAQTYSDDDLLAEIRRVADVTDADGAPSIQDFRDHSDIADTTVLRRFDSWNAAVATAGFEPNDPQQRIPTEDLIDELQRLGDEVGRAPTVTEMNDQGNYYPSTYRRRFGSWAAALDTAFEHIDADNFLESRQVNNPDDPAAPGPQVSDERLLEHLRELADELGEPPRFKQMADHGDHGARTYTRRYGSWAEALEAAGLDPADRSSRQQVSDDDLLADLHRLRDELGRVPTATDVVEEGTHGIATYQRRFGSWSEALDAAEIDPDDDRPSDDELLADLHRLHEERDKVPSLLDVQDDGEYTETQYRSRFGSWREALEAAGFDADRGPTDRELLAELRRLRDDLDKRPSMNDMTDHGAYGCTTYRRHFGSWSAALEEAFDAESP
ncbi:hypothetical protein DVK07_12730 [Halorubrum sp. Atlit-26R]|nr:hypothetical protein DVK07_12730 [Halorubrum sp. Atlit-26R]